MKILFITSTRLGDGVLSTGILNYLVQSYPDAKITIACGPLLAEIFSAAPGVEQVISLQKKPYGAHWLTLAPKTLWKKWDIVVDLRNSLLSRVLFAPEKYIWNKADKTRHKVEQLAELVGAAPSPAPVLWCNDRITEKAQALAPPGMPILGIAPAAATRLKTWPAENFIELITRLTAQGGILPDARIAVFAAPGEEDIALQVLDSVPKERQLNVIAKGSPLVAAATLARCSFYVGNDSGLTHCAAAAGVPTLGLFGPSWPRLYRPWGSHTAYVSTPENYDQLIAKSGYVRGQKPTPCLMTTLTVDAVYDAAVQLWNKSVEF